MNTELLIECFKDTNILSNSSILKENTEYAKNNTRVYKENFVSSYSEYGYQAEFIRPELVIVKEGTSFDVAREYMQNNKYAKIGVLNFANPHYAGGGVTNGAMAQEECLCRSSNLYSCLTTDVAQKEFYNYHKTKKDFVFSDRVIYSEGITVFKSDDEIPLIFPQQDWFKVSVLTCAAPYTPKNSYINEPELLNIFKKRIKNIFEVAMENSISILVLGAFGCGAFNNPPEIVAKAFDEVIDESIIQYYALFEKIIFAIKKPTNGSICHNLITFEKQFKDKYKSSEYYFENNID